jgi:hypothetical protein
MNSCKRVNNNNVALMATNELQSSRKRQNSQNTRLGNQISSITICRDTAPNASKTSSKLLVSSFQPDRKLSLSLSPTLFQPSRNGPFLKWKLSSLGNLCRLGCLTLSKKIKSSRRPNRGRYLSPRISKSVVGRRSQIGSMRLLFSLGTCS